MKEDHAWFIYLFQLAAAVLTAISVDFCFVVASPVLNLTPSPFERIRNVSIWEVVEGSGDILYK